MLYSGVSFLFYSMINNKYFFFIMFVVTLIIFLKNYSKSDYKKLLLIIFFIFCAISLFVILFGEGIFPFYSFLLFVLLTFLLFRKFYRKFLKSKLNWLIYFFILFIMIFLFFFGREVDSYFEIARMVTNEIEEYFIEHSEYPEDLEYIIPNSYLADIMRNKRIKYYYSKYDDSNNYILSIYPGFMGVDFILYRSKTKRYVITD
jgi:hypothetical protein